MAVPAAGALSENGAGQATIARICDYWLGGSQHTEADRRAGDHILLCAPHLAYVLRTQQAQVDRMVRYLTAAGIRQFLDLGSRLPTAGNVHEIARECIPESRVLYVDHDTEVARDGARLLAGDERAGFLHADPLDPVQVLGSSALRGLLDLREPTAVLMTNLLQHVPDSADPAALVGRYVGAVSPGSYLGISHFGSDEQLVTGLGMFNRMFGTPPPVTLREPEQIRPFFAGLELVEPGIVPLPLWRPTEVALDDRNPEEFRVYVGLGHKRLPG
ncbi:SAM-dependent methyltransferase [Amycolatopsis aidingensis]|uniref:SAM-dependent methyltransferase n=1 Tax=Amycolatopsis aidingensis TaxID=2842453 RepID=UPI001C0B9CF6|nr:SAM-dependent methyltransferase [Amycolatopsis aidingensis]